MINVPSLNVQPQAQFQLETGICPKETRKYIFTSVSAIGQVSCSPSSHVSDAQNTVAQHQDKLQFIALLEMLLTFDPTKRADPSSCLQQPFITMLHLALQTTSPWSVHVVRNVGDIHYNTVVIMLQCSAVDRVHASLLSLPHDPLIATQHHTHSYPYSATPLYT